jgi:hypothetical protein
LDSVSGSPTNGMYYITTSAAGQFNITGDYTCTLGDPVYLYASGGNPNTVPPVQLTGASAAPDAAGNLLVTYTTTGNQFLYQGETVTFSTPFNPSNTAYEGDAGITATVSPLNLTNTSFAFEGGPSSTSYAYASFTGTVTQTSAPSNPAIVNTAVLGNCPTPVPVTLTGAYETDDVNGKLLVTFSNSGTNHFTAGEQVTFGSGIPAPYNPFNGTTQTVSSLVLGPNQFSVELGPYAGSSISAAFTASVYPPANFGSSSASPISFVYMNEISTVAMAYALAPFTAVSSTQNDTVHIGSSSTNLVGLQNAANNAANLYDIRGYTSGTGGNGDVHIANAFTPNGNGQVPQKLISTLGNILANCVDSANTYNAATAAGGTASAQCSKLFAIATSDGSATGAQPNDTATAILNIATHPSGSTANPSFVTNLYNLPTGNVPFQPSAGTAPHDFVIGIIYTGSQFVNPGECAGDSLGNEWCADIGANTLTKLSPLGVVQYSLTVPSAFHTMVDLSNNVWAVSQGGNAVYEFTSAGVAVAGSPYTAGGAFSTPAGITNDGNGDTYVVNYGASNLITIKGSGTTATFATSQTTCSSYDTTSAADSAGYGWTSGGNANQACRVSSAGVLAATITGLNGPSSVDIDSSGRAWIPNHGNNTLAQVMPTTTTPFYTLSTFSGGGLSGPGGVAIDGAGNIWVGNGTAYSGGSTYSVSEFTNAGVAVTGAGGYQAGQLNYPRFLSIDISGNIWFSNYTGASVEQLIGAATPAVRPKALAVKNGTLGTRP